jgi:hypothetical protein
MQVGIHELTFFFKMNPWAPERKIGLTWASAPFSRKSSVYNAKGRHYSFVRADYAGIAISAHCRMTQPAAKMVCVMELLDHGARSAEGQVTGKIWSHGGFWYHTNPKGPEYVTQVQKCYRCNVIHLGFGTTSTQKGPEYSYVTHIPHDIRLKDPNLPLRSGNGRGQNI